NIAPKTRLLELQRQLEKTRGERDRGSVGIEQARSSIFELETEIENSRANYRLRALDELNTVVGEQSELAESLPRLEERVSRTVIRAPMEGIVSRLNFRTPGGFVKTGDIVLELVPTGEALIVEAKIKPQDISRIRMDDHVRIRLSAYDSAKYGSIDGRVLRISADAVVDERNQGASHYLADVAIEGKLLLEEAGQAVTLIPGMTATVDVLSGKRSVLEYIWQPVARVKELALRD
ncbi:HlyD family secretion protein, partial [Amylibacter sp.]|nr:HlyD family secretion protein [Amylibacter sp.]